MMRIAIRSKNRFSIGSLRAGIRNASVLSLVASALRIDLDVSMYQESLITHRIRGTAKLEPSKCGAVLYPGLPHDASLGKLRMSHRSVTQRGQSLLMSLSFQRVVITSIKNPSSSG